MRSRKSRAVPLVAALAFFAAAVTPAGSVAGAPIVRPFPELVSQEGDRYVGVLNLDEWVDDPTASDAELEWTFEADTQLLLDLTPDRHLVARPPTQDWEGVEQVLFRVCNPSGECAVQTASFCVVGSPDDPVIEWIPDQIVGDGTLFAPLDLRFYGWDPDPGEEPACSVRNGATLRAEVRDGVLSVIAPTAEWVGTDEIFVELRDPTGRSASRAIRYVAVRDVPVTITALGVEGFLIQHGTTKILIDALVRDALPLSASERRRLQNALPPYDGVTLALASHPHYDHFDPSYATEFLVHSPETVFVSVAESVDALRGREGFERIAPRVFGIPFHEGDIVPFEIGGVRLTAYALHHTGPGDLPNLAFLIEIGAVRILHLGDATESVSASELVRWFDWPSLRIDVVMGSARWLAGAGSELVAAAAAPRFAVPMHFGGLCPASSTYAPGAGYDVVVLCSKGATWIVPTMGDVDS